MYYVYILQSKKNGRYYIGSTNNIDRRLSEHNSGQTKSLRYIKPLALVYAVKFNTRTEACREEQRIKQQKSRKYIKELIKGL